MPDAGVIPVLAYPDVLEAAGWLEEAFGFRVRLRIADHRVQLVHGDGAVVVAQGSGRPASDSLLVRVDNADEHHRSAVEAGAIVVSAPADYPYGERQYTVEDLVGRRWTFSQSIADVDPADWGGALVDG
jgi:uncharacterized glyoxalase superfamily protein PhnB